MVVDARPTPEGPKLKSSASTSTVTGVAPGPMAYVVPATKASSFPIVIVTPSAVTVLKAEIDVTVELVSILVELKPTVMAVVLMIVVLNKVVIPPLGRLMLVMVL